MNTVSEEGIAKINATSRLVLRKRGDSAVEFYNDAQRLYVLHFIEVAEIGGHRVMYLMTRLADGKRGRAPTGICLMARRLSSKALDIMPRGMGLHFMVMHLLKCQEIAELKAFILENCDEFAVAAREQIVLLHDFEDKMHESDDEK